MNKFIFFCIFFLTILISTPIYAQNEQEEDAKFIREIYNFALTEASCYEWLRGLTSDIGGRMAGSPQAEAAVPYIKQILDTLGLDTVHNQACTVPTWVRGEKEMARIVNSTQIGTQEMNATALGHSIGTGKMGIAAEVIECTA